VSLWLFATGRLDAQIHFYAPLAVLIFFFTVRAVIRDKQTYEARTLRQVIAKAIGKYLMWGLVLYGVTRFYEWHPLYHSLTPNTRVFMDHYLRLFTWIGLPYFVLAEKTRTCLDNVLSDPYIKVRVLMRDLWKRRFKQAGFRLTTQRYRRTYLMAILRIHYVPLMVEQIHLYAIKMTGILQADHVQWSLATVVFTITLMVWFIDSTNGAMGYFWESCFTKTRFKDIDPYPIHWFVVLLCYMPFIRYAAEFVPFPEASRYAVPLFSHQAINNGMDIVLVIALVLYVMSGSALNFSTSNLCYKQIQTKGPYRIVRHPATTCKLIFFAVAFFRFKTSYTVAGILCYLVWFTVYICRALVEERFLKRFPDYQRYMKQTRYRFIPGLI
jgi:protein-S-isoprenylcysteine O-methyltransferase Ste14